ncbi:hypothetical protein HPB52_010253 [Rhipicephalus sanguineus]|uniref:Uncharacterized protein n=1 Tax=Rhipicephalus sanguineus TaxID=34632 RepID=A0A9D4SSC0_RHISA|nr:hypothetical protein HPB52_010253 [Rhipicephalus sanguineus]
MNPSSSEVGGSSPEQRRPGPVKLTPVHQRSSRRLRGEELQRQRLDPSAPAVSSLADVVREEFRMAVRDPQPIRGPQHYAQTEAPPQRPQRSSYADALLQGPHVRMDVAATSITRFETRRTPLRSSAFALLESTANCGPSSRRRRTPSRIIVSAFEMASCLKTS